MYKSQTFESYADAKIEGGDYCRVITTGPNWSGSKELKNKFKIYNENSFRMCDIGWVFAKPQDYCLTYDYHTKLGNRLCEGDVIEISCNELDGGTIIVISNNAQIMFAEHMFDAKEIFVLSRVGGIDSWEYQNEDTNKKIAEYKEQIEILKNINKSNLKDIEQYTKLIQFMSK